MPDNKFCIRKQTALYAALFTQVVALISIAIICFD
ncbi:hypothetical protein SIN8267_02543 [Sinobacterium norvegicum]|uniref:Uncharacterized protein n=1 Tax=Sinobacterium norvegicum TaxID=1641715 RepID=A0ABM9AGS8_9GAMM|nr:hypothetical protein SIN8267_02543 [Sinobacterium norvegicum]